MDPQKKWEDLFNWANEGEENRKKAIFVASQFIAMLNQDKTLSKEEMDKIIGGAGMFCCEGGKIPQ